MAQEQEGDVGFDELAIAHMISRTVELKRQKGEIINHHVINEQLKEAALAVGLLAATLSNVTDEENAGEIFTMLFDFTVKVFHEQQKG